MNVYVCAMIFCLLFIFITIELIRRQKLREQYAIMWLILGVIMALCSFFPTLLSELSLVFGIYYAPSLLFLVGMLFSLIFIMHLTIVISKLQGKQTRLIQEVALLQERIRQGGSE